MFEARMRTAEKELIFCEERIRALEKQLRIYNTDPAVGYMPTGKASAAIQDSGLNVPKSSAGVKSGKKSPAKNIKSKKK